MKRQVLNCTCILLLVTSLSGCVSAPVPTVTNGGAVEPMTLRAIWA